MNIRTFPLTIACLSMLLLGALAFADDAINLLRADGKNLGWQFNNGAEYKGATGGLSVETSDKHEGRDTLRLDGDFTRGGAYVQASCELPKTDLRELSFWIKYPGIDQVTIRIGDASGQCHQIRLRLKVSDDWQQVVFPLQRFFSKRGTSESPMVVSRYESWGGAKDGNWHGPGKNFALLMSIPKTEPKARTLLLSDVKIAPTIEPAPVSADAKGNASSSTESSASAPAPSSIIESVKLDEVIDGTLDWTFNNGAEFKGAKGALTVVKNEPEKGKNSLKINGDFTKGGAYVGIDRELKSLEMNDLAAIRFKFKSENVETVVIRLIDGSKQCHQVARYKVIGDGNWHDVVIRPKDVVGGEHWGGANDGKWHGPALLFSIYIHKPKDVTRGLTPEVMLSDITADILKGGVVQAASFKCDFENSKELPADWTAQGNVGVDATLGFKGERSLKLERSAIDRDKPCFVTSSSFPVTTGKWNLSLAVKSNLVSDDASYNGEVTLEMLDGASKVAGKITLAEVYGVKNWQPIVKQVDIPAGVSLARIRTELNKSIGQFWLDEISASYVAPAETKDHRINRIVFSTAQLGNMLFPQDSRKVDVVVEATKPLTDAQHELTYVLRDYWGAECAPAETVKLDEGKRGANKRWAYHATIDLSNKPLEIGRYYELHAQLPQEGNEPFSNYSSLAILPAPITKNYKPEEIPFTGRNWDNRMADYFVLSDRIGIRICGVWGSWESTPPYKPKAPQIELCEKLGMGVLTGTPINMIEYHRKGYEKYDETALRTGIKNWIEQYGKIRPLMVDLGNEPHGTGERVLENIAAYKTVYEEIKRIDPSITVIGSSMGPEEEYFQNGFQNYLDVYDFHIYEDSAGVRAAFKRYEELFAKYGGKKPIWSTELGLNSQGLPRLVVAREVVRKLTIFFAAGGQNVSWFGLLYPDPDGKALGTNGESFNVFDCRYNKYCPKIDAVAYYNMINSICIKKFVAEKKYESGIEAFLFRDRDNRCMQVLWKNQGSADVFVPLPGVGKTTLIDIDGRRAELDAEGTGLSLSVMEDPIILMYDSKDAPLAEKLGAPLASVDWPAGVIKGGTVDASIVLNGIPEDRVEMIAPAAWKIQRGQVTRDSSGKARLPISISSPEETKAREGDVLVRIKSKNNLIGEMRSRLQVTSRITITTIPVPAAGSTPAAVKVVVHNFSVDAQSIAWKLEMSGQIPMTEGKFGTAESSSAYFASAAEGSLAVGANEAKEIIVPLSGIDPQTVYLTKATATDASGRTSICQRPVAGFTGIPRVAGPIKLDGTLDDPAWQKSPVLHIDTARQYRVFDRKSTWKGVDDVSAVAQFLWDEKYLYIGVKVKDDVFCNKYCDDSIWNGDGIQFLIDPARTSAQKPGKYDYALGVGTKGPQAVCNMSADTSAPMGLAPDVIVTTKRLSPDRGDMTYVIAIPWTRIAPFKAEVGANLGLAIAINEDDGPGRGSYLSWFGDVGTKEISPVGDLILMP